MISPAILRQGGLQGGLFLLLPRACSRLAPDGPPTEGAVPKERGGKKPCRLIQYELIAGDPYAAVASLLQENLLWEGHVCHEKLAAEEATPAAQGPRRRSHKLREMVRILGLVSLAALTAACGVKGQTPATDEPSTIRFERISERPYIPRVPGTFFSVLVANPAVIDFKGDTFSSSGARTKAARIRSGYGRPPHGRPTAYSGKSNFPNRSSPSQPARMRPTTPISWTRRRW